MDSNSIPPALAALAAFPALHAQVGHSVAAQARRIAERQAHYIGRPTLLKSLDERIHATNGGLIALEGAPGSGTTTLLCHLAATRPYAFWLPEDAAGDGVAALCAQLLALHQLPIALVPPAVDRDATALEQLLAEAGAARPTGDPLVVLIGRPPDDQTTPIASLFPATIPPGVVIVLACAPKAILPLRAATRVALPSAGTRLQQRLTQTAIQRGCAPELAPAVAAHSHGAFLYAYLATGLLRSGGLHARALPDGLAALHGAWWQQLSRPERWLAAVIAAAGEPLDLPLWAAVAGTAYSDTQHWLRRWQPFLEVVENHVQLYHAATRSFIAEQSDDQLAGAHAAYVMLARERFGMQLAQIQPEHDGYLVRQLARHVALSDPATKTETVPQIASRAWVLARERTSGTMRAAAQDIAWMIRATDGGDTLQLVRRVAIGGTLALLARRLAPDAAADAFEKAINNGGARDPTLKRVRAMVDQLPDGRDKAEALRRLGEACYGQRMRASAMRMLSEALDLEAPGPPRTWRDEREETLVAFARAANAIDLPQTALGITARISHAERRGMIETEVVRWMLAHGERTRAEEVAYAIGHLAMHEWAMAEVAVGHARAGDIARGEIVLGTLRTETAIAWARGELACDAAHQGDPHAARAVQMLENLSLRDRALALVAQALVVGGLPDAAIETARLAQDRDVRARALIDIALQEPPNASAALALAATDIVALSGDDRASLVAALAAAQAAVGRMETALHTIALLPEEEEQARAQSRIAVALAQHGNPADAQIVAEAIGDSDERDWALDELARLAASAGDWDAALALATQIDDDAQRAHSTADLAITLARSGAATQAHAQIERIEIAAERTRAHGMILGPLVAAGAKARALATLAQFQEPDARSRYQAALTAALATHGELLAAHGLARTIARPLDRARALVAIAHAAADSDLPLAYQEIAAALRVAASLGRSETCVCLAWAGDTLAKLGGGELLLATASALDEIDSWWG
jgi:tetratricopeptide (TPR) repeat protein